VIDWLDGGAFFLYVCGDAKSMAKDVRATLVHARAEVKALTPEAAERAVAELERNKRYLLDLCRTTCPADISPHSPSGAWVSFKEGSEPANAIAGVRIVFAALVLAGTAVRPAFSQFPFQDRDRSKSMRVPPAITSDLPPQRMKLSFGCRCRGHDREYLSRCRGPHLETSRQQPPPSRQSRPPRKR
jgi:hypothetical protein